MSLRELERDGSSEPGAGPGRVGLASSALRLLRNFDARLVAPGSAHRLACVRAVLAATLTLRIAIGAWWHLGGRPDVLFRPVGVTHLLPGGVPSASALVVIQVVGVVAGLLALVGNLPVPAVTRGLGPFGGWAGRWPRAALVVAWLALLTLAGVHTSAGKVMHNDVLLLLATIPVLFSPRGAVFGSRACSVAYGWPARAALVVVAGVYALTGLQKVLHSGPAWVFSDNMSWVLYQGASSGLAPDLARWVAGVPVLPSLFAAGAISLELGAPVILGLRRTRPLYLLVSASMHASIALFLGLDYASWVLTVAAVALPWDGVPWAGRPWAGSPWAGRLMAGRPWT